MSKPVNTIEFWRERLKAEHLPDSVYVTNGSDWRFIDSSHEKILSPYVDKKVLDAGCGYGRWASFFRDYTGIDFSPDFIDKAKELHRDKTFIQADLNKLPFKDKEFDMAFCVSVKVMIVNNLGEEVWKPMEEELKRVAKKVILLEYTNPQDYEEIN